MLADFWFSVRDGRLAPSVSTIAPTQFKSLLPAIWMCDVIEGNPDGRFRYRLVGDHIRTAHGTNPTGKTVTQITEKDALERVLSYFNAVADRPAIVHVIGRLFAETPNPAKGERLILPFCSADDGRVVRLLGATIHSWEFERGQSSVEIPDKQIRTFLPVDGSESWSEDWL